MQEPPATPAGPDVHRILSLSLQVVMAVGAVLAAVEGLWFNVVVISGILVLTLLPLLLDRRFRIYIPAEFELLAVLFLFASLFLGWIHGYYLRFTWWDVALHAGSGFLLGILGFLLVYALNQNERVELQMKAGFIAFFAFCFAVAAGAVWEIFEFAMDELLQAGMQHGGLLDTMWDLIVDSVAAGVTAVLGYLWLRSGEDSFLERWIAEFVAKNPEMFERG